jgi:phospholipid/cholesterol/gamma-HCH transport system ATP-binding protein
VIRVQGLYKRFGAQEVLRGLDLDIATGEIMVVIGRSGGGKSVLLKHMIGLLRPDAGAILVDGTDITRLRGRALDRVRERYGVVFQGGALFDSMSVWDNVAFPLREKSRRTDAEIRARVEEKLEQVGLGGMGDKNPAEISGGMRKRVAIARALVTEPEIVFFDEPTTGLDPILVNTIHHLIVDLHRKFRFTAVMVSHEIPEIFEIAGVEVGRVDRIVLQDYQAHVVMVIQPGVKLQDDSIASIKTKGLIGERYVRISPGGSDKIIPPNGRIREVEPPVDIEELLSKYIFGKV